MQHIKAYYWTAFLFIVAFYEGNAQRVNYFLKKGFATIDSTQTLVLCVLPSQDKNFITSEHCVKNSECGFELKKHQSRRNGVDYEIRIFRKRAYMSGDILTCVISKNLLVHIEKMPFDTKNCFKPSIRSIPIVIDGIDVTINGWFMDRNHFQGLNNNNSAVLYVPRNKLVRLFVGVAYLGQHKCFFHHNRHSLQPSRTDPTPHRYSRYIFDIKAGKDEGDGEYMFRCSTVFVSMLDREEQTIAATKKIMIHSTRDPSVIIFGTPDSIIFPVGIKNTLTFSVFSSSNVETVRVTKDSSSDTLNAMRTFVSGYNHYYEIVFYRPNIVNNGKYRIEATVGKNQMKPRATFNIIISNYPQVTVFPVTRQIGIGQRVSFDCVATGLNVFEIKWEREGDLELESNMVVERVNTIMNDSISYRLTVNNAKQDDSGLYTCVAESAHSKHTTTKEVTLIVSQPGSDSIDSNYRPLNASYADESDNNDHLEIADEDLFREWGELDEGELWRTISRLSRFQLITIAVAAGCILLGVLALFLVICVVCCCTRNRNTQKSSRSTTLLDIDSGGKYKSERKKLMKGNKKKQKSSSSSSEESVSDEKSKRKKQKKRH